MKIVYIVRKKETKEKLGEFNSMKDAREWAERFDPETLIYTKIIDA